MEKGDDALPRKRLVAANDNDAPLSPEADAALTVIARAIGRQLAREAMRAMQAANDNEPKERG